MSDVDRFEVFVRRYQDMVFATAVRLLGRQADAEDVAQTVFLKAFERFDQIGTSPAAPGWLKTVTTNLCLNHLTRHRSRWRLFSEMSRETAEGDGAAFEESLAAPEADDAADEAERGEVLQLALQRLPDHQRVPLVLFHYEERSYQDIAALLGVSLGKVKTDIHRGREALRKYVGDS
jgi:RNA polymerase sigma-70 factor (ECF subfamily)